MPRTVVLLFVLLLPVAAYGQTDDDYAAVHRAVLDYVDALYDVRPALIERSVSPRLAKIGYVRRTDADGAATYREGAMTYDELMRLAGTWNADQRRADPEAAPKYVTVLDVLDQTATAKLEAQWGVDYLQLAKQDGRWRIVHVLWQSSPPGAAPAQPAEPDTLRVDQTEDANGSTIRRATGEAVTGVVVETYPNGAKKMRRTAVDGKPEGVWMEWYASGQPRYIGTWKDGKGHGVWTYFHETGEISERAEVVRDVWHGRAEGWHANGRKAFEGRNWRGARDGTWRFWAEDGALDRVEHYRRGDRVDADSDGR